MNRGKWIFGCGALLWGTLACEGELDLPEPLPVADAGFDQVRYLGDASELTVELDARASCDPNNAAFQEAIWTVVNAPGNPPAPVASELGATLTVTEAGEYVLALQVQYGDRLSEPDYVAIRVQTGAGQDVVVAPPSTTACGDTIED